MKLLFVGSFYQCLSEAVVLWWGCKTAKPMPAESSGLLLGLAAWFLNESGQIKEKSWVWVAFW
jgi:hypothetical protein